MIVEIKAAGVSKGTAIRDSLDFVSVNQFKNQIQWAEFGKAFESKAAEAQQSFAGLVDSAAKNAPAGSETAVAMLKSAVAAANNAFESVQKAVKQASDVAEANFQAVSSTAVNAAKSTSQVASRKR